MTGDNWSEHCRELMIDTGEGVYVAVFYVSFMLVVSLVLVNVVIAVLLDEFAKVTACVPSCPQILARDCKMRNCLPDPVTPSPFCAF